ncbi:TIGR03986 family CRISPR-associated RAMP protein [Campylobacter fetus]|uniref:TIGR03986 family type III CRISPR-associated RAMP protein n=1 Tax=Campylobacter fetus TaxID=196 RepID=UPI00073A5B8C|nr:TIGR03986 family CRISPR-associated RAMP protein [Campylobacter fetus]ALV65642.1 CRISPR/Cas system-associated RAMP protein [Campylobacter fetus subsp. testudinum Sp3]
MITAPYNFVPLNEQIFYPDWADNVSHDIPFSDAQSGEIDITITAKNPIFIKNHTPEGSKETLEFCHHINENGEKEYYIPSSSVKGMIRNVLEIISFGKIKIDSKFNTISSVRDMTNNSLVGKANKCGFLIEIDGNTKLLDCGNIITISHKILEKDYPELKSLKTAKDKYTKYDLLKEVKFTTKKEKFRTVALLSNDNNKDAKSGYLVFTGDIENKKYEFIFKNSSNYREISDDTKRKFLQVYDNNKSIDGEYLIKKSPKKIPVFFVEKDQKIEVIGITQLFKLAYNKTIADAAKQAAYQENKLDLSETIFGTVTNSKALKGRVYFSHFKATAYKFATKKEVILGTPNPSYYPNYIQQTKKANPYITLMNENAKISGWKRYPLHSELMKPHLPNDNQDVRTTFIPLDKNTTFQGKLKFHNLKKVEIGALLSAITFHDQGDICMHNIGMAKALGYGKIDIKLELQNLKFDKKEYLKKFEELMTNFKSDWKNSDQLVVIFAMANITTKTNKQLAYQLLKNPKLNDFTNKPEKNDFIFAKKAKKYLKAHSQNNDLA